ESRLQLARELNIGDAKAINDIRTDIHKLRNMIGTDAQSNSLGPLIEDLDARTDTLALSNRTTDHILNPEKPAIGDWRVGYSESWLRWLCTKRHHLWGVKSLGSFGLSRDFRDCLALL